MLKKFLKSSKNDKLPCNLYSLLDYVLRSYIYQNFAAIFI